MNPEKIFNLINSSLGFSLALVVIFTAIRFFLKKQDLGFPLMEFGPRINATLLTVFIFAPQLFLLFFQKIHYENPLKHYGYAALYSGALLGSLYLGLQRKSFSENGISLPPYFILTWAEIEAYQLISPEEAGGPGRVIFMRPRRILAFQWTDSRELEVPGEIYSLLESRLPVYLPFKEEAAEKN
ncbi:MAG: hypothetical protein WBK48_03540 [Dethiobacteria bacterium]|nr:hypothetical protein [Bacillota bacterium]